MSEITVRALTEDEWATYRTLRLEALQESPEAFVADHATEAAEPEEFWRTRMSRSVRLVAEVDDELVGVASLGTAHGGDDATAGQLFGLWVAPAWRGKSVAANLVSQGARIAEQRGFGQLFYWVGSDNGRAVAFASSFGFRPTDERRAMRTASDAGGEEEIALVLALGDDRG
ncbi:GNAT family N-acetyltransferase [Janibacter terrae]|jgi:ribosomal protein S18 acetylase RimI-like enzyme|uniref:GNAT family N-acetyltransferase n=1 Tax=Janibacter terrae TaxID=103817 RepID=A0ABZ2FCX4_9MICO|nr:GNAT family N-acetyltransferase [Janibacter terrae]MBA4084088.1 N-acetyltransferase [Kytococcus sp.]HBO55303.1 N-acetyltransferase [Janibacter terrae]